MSFFVSGLFKKSFHFYLLGIEFGGLFLQMKTKRSWMVPFDIYQTVKRYIKHWPVRKPVNSLIPPSTKEEFQTLNPLLFVKCVMIEI